MREVGRNLGLQTRREVKVGRRLWGTEQYIDVVMTLTESGHSLGLECKHQGGFAWQHALVLSFDRQSRGL